MIQELKTKLIEVNQKRQTFLQQAEERKNELNNLSIELDNSEEALLILQHVAKQTQEELEYQISEIVSLALRAVFDDPYEFKVEFEIKRGKTEAKIFLFKNNKEFDPLRDTGGGVADITAFALRIALWNLARPKSRNCILLDEPFKNLNPPQLRSKAVLILKLIAEKLNIQYIIATHDPYIVKHADNFISIIKENNISKILPYEDYVFHFIEKNLLKEKFKEKDLITQLEKSIYVPDEIKTKILNEY